MAGRQTAQGNMELLISLGALIWFMTYIPTNGAHEYKIHASVMGRPGSNDIQLYRKVADIMFREDVPHKGSINHCAINFKEFTFDMTNGSTVYDSLTTARSNFESKDVAVAIGPAIDVFTSTEYVILNQVHLLTSPASESSSRVISVLPQANSMSAAIADIVTKLGWNNVALLAQDDFSPVLTLGTAGIKVWPIRLSPKISSEDDRELQKNLIQLRSSQNDKFILHSNNREVIRSVMEAAKRLHLLHHSIDWFVTYPDFQDIIKDDEGAWPGSLFGLQLLRSEKIPQNVSGLMESFKISRLQLGLAVDVVGILRHVLWGAAHDCSRGPIGGDFIIGADDFESSIKSQDRPYQGALGQYIWQMPDNTKTNYSINVLWYNTTLNEIGSCTFINGTPEVHFAQSISKSGNVKHVFGKDEILQVVTKQDDPFVMKEGDNYVGFNIDLLRELSESLNFKYNIVDVTDNKYDDSHNGQLNGMVQELMNGNASMAIGALEVTAEREEVISFSYTILSSKASLLIKKAKSTRNFFQFLGPFSIGLWFMIVGFVIVAGLTMFIMSHYDQTQNKSEQKFDLKESMWYSLNILLQGTTDYSPQTTSTRTIISFFWFCVLVIDAAYTANLAAYLTLQQIDDRIRTVYDLAEQTDILYGVEKDSSLMHYIEGERQDPYERMWAFIKLHETETLLKNTTQVIEKVTSGEFTFIADGVVNEYYAKQHCGIESVEQHFGHKDYSLGFPRGAPYRDDINRALLELKERGRLDYLKEKWWAPGTNCTDDDSTISRSDKATAELQIDNMFGVFLVLAGFVVLALVCEVGDRIFDCHTAKKAKKEKKNGNSPSEDNFYVSADDVDVDKKILKKIEEDAKNLQSF
ncbi:glutamate receptor ionotropic, kainate 2 isoform X2 [Patella vulgata]|uniref:glutamate receptor ionotropic, kainate 2 isoform X2 n=1 Tax=Patella vulgata TaxID=6465 RepID=UPI0021803F23|nr:glutamate receptor ionotropic, kainate 2 isoform X2 [Patella vulgata]